MVPLTNDDDGGSVLCKIILAVRAAGLNASSLGWRNPS
jgi:hypothetical protein